MLRVSAVELRWRFARSRGKKTAIVGVYGEGATAQLKIAVQAPPIEGRANSALIEFLADKFDVPRSYVELVTGELSRSKAFLLKGVSLGQAETFIKEWVK